MSELESLASRVSDLNSKVDFWNSAVLWALLITALAAAAIVFSQRLAFIRAKQLADVQDKISRLKEADARVAQDRVETELAKQQERAAIADGKVAGLEENAADAKTEMAKQQIRAATAERSLLELQERVKPRHLSADCRKQLIELLKPATKGAIEINHLVLDEESRSFAMQIYEALREAGWSSNGVRSEMITGGTPPIGLLIVFHSEKAIPSHAAVLIDAFSKIGLSPTLGKDLNIPEGTVGILVGVKP